MLQKGRLHFAVNVLLSCAYVAQVANGFGLAPSSPLPGNRFLYPVSLQIDADCTHERRIVGHQYGHLSAWARHHSGHLWGRSAVHAAECMRPTHHASGPVLGPVSRCSNRTKAGTHFTVGGCEPSTLANCPSNHQQVQPVHRTGLRFTLMTRPHDVLPGWQVMERVSSYRRRDPPRAPGCANQINSCTRCGPHVQVVGRC